MPIFRKNFLVVTSLLIVLLIKPANNLISTGFSRNNNPSPASSQELISAVNSLRVSNGLPPYKVNQILMTIAQAHSDYQASIGTVTHYGSDGSRPFQRALAAGYQVAGDLTLGGYFSENIAAGNNYSSLDAVNSWQLDAPHVNTMLSSTLQDIGAGVSMVGNYIYFTIDVGLSANSQKETPADEYFTSTANSFYPVITNKILTSTPEIDGTIFHVVKAGDTIWSLSRAYNISESDIKVQNSLIGDTIYIGDKLIIRLPYTPTPTIPTRTETMQPSHTSTIISSATEKTSPTVEPVQEILPSLIGRRNIVISIILFSIFISGLLAILLKANRNKQ